MEPAQRGASVPVVGDGTLVTRSRAIARCSLRSFLATNDAPRVVWTAPEEATIAGCGAAAIVTADGADRFQTVQESATDLFTRLDTGEGPEAARPRLFGGFAFHEDHAATDPWDGFPGAQFVLPAIQVIRTDEASWVTVNAVSDDPEAVEDRLDTVVDELRSLSPAGPATHPPGVHDRRRTTSREEWRGQVEAAVARIESGDLRKVVLAQALDVDLADTLSVPDALARLRGRYPDCYRFLVEPSDGQSFFGATPERLVSLRGRTVATEALAGSTGRGDTPEEDEWLSAELLASAKDNHEHDLVVEAIRDQLEPFAAGVRTGARDVRRLDTVQHLRTPIRAKLNDAEHVLDLVEALHPTPAVGGLPPGAAQRTIRETETFDRGWYASPVGWFDAAGNGTFAVGIRSAVAGSDAATLFAGAGIVADSDPDREWDEIQLKYRPILDALER